MADGLASESAATVESMFSRRIDFHPARKPYSALSAASAGGGEGDFRLETLNPSVPQRTADSGTGAVVEQRHVKRSENWEFYELGLDPEISFKTSFRRIGAGLRNLGNTCFLNSVLQCLTYTEPFAAYLQSGKHKTSCRTAGFCALCALQNHVMAALESTGKILSPKHLVQNLRCISRNFRNARQEDAHEYMVNLLESMHKCCLPSGVPSESPSAYEKSLVHKIFGGHLRSQVKCTKCGYCSNKSDPFLDLSLEIHKADSLLKALRHFTAVEELDGGQRQYQCDRCKEKVRALKQLTIHKAPCVLTIHLKRFDSHIPGQKIDRKVEFEPTLDLKPFVSGPKVGDLKYTLYGVLVHAGWSTHSGHYYCYVRTSTGMWHSLDDNQVSQVSEKSVLSQKAYMLFYVLDRTTLVKRPADTFKKENTYAYAPGVNKIPPPISDSNKKVQNILMDKKLSNTESSFPKAMTSPSSHGQFSGLKSSSDDKMSDRGSIANGNGSSKELQQTSTSEMDSKKSTTSVDKHIQIAKKDSNQPPAHVDKMATLDYVNVPPLAPVCDKSNARNNHSSNGCNVEVKSDVIIVQSISDGSNVNEKPDIPIAQPSSISDPSLPRHENNEKLKDTQVQQSGAVTSENGQTKVTCMKQAKSLIAEKGPNMHLSQSDDMVVRNEAPETVASCQVIAGYELNNCSSNMNQNGGDLLGIEKKMTIKSTEPSNFGSKKQAISEKGPTHSPKKQKQNKTINLLMGFGRNKLFLSSLSRQKFKKSRNKKHHLYSNNVSNKVVPINILVNDEGASTSEGVNGVRVDSNHFGKKSSLKRRHHSASVDNLNQTIEHKDLKPTNRSVESTTRNSDAVDNSVQPNQFSSSSTTQCMPIEKDETKKGLSKNDVAGFLRENTVGGWDDVPIPKYDLYGLTNSRENGIGYVLDDWDEEYDRGKRRKVKKSVEEFTTANPFQETANEKAKHMLKALKRHGNQPFRI